MHVRLLFLSVEDQCETATSKIEDDGHDGSSTESEYYQDADNENLEQQQESTVSPLGREEDATDGGGSEDLTMSSERLLASAALNLLVKDGSSAKLSDRDARAAV